MSPRSFWGRPPDYVCSLFESSKSQMPERCVLKGRIVSVNLCLSFVVLNQITRYCIAIKRGRALPRHHPSMSRQSPRFSSHTPLPPHRPSPLQTPPPTHHHLISPLTKIQTQASPHPNNPRRACHPHGFPHTGATTPLPSITK